MKSIVQKPKDNILNFMRSLGYHFERQTGKQWTFAKSLGGGAYPKFHLYLSEFSDGIEFNLHIDQKAASYSGTNMHSGEYEGELITKEMERIKQAM